MKPHQDKIYRGISPIRTFRVLVAACAFIAAAQFFQATQWASAQTIPYERGIGKVKGLIAGKQFGDAEQLLSAMLRDYPGNPEILSLRGRIYLWSGKPSAAISDFSRSLQRREDPSIRTELAKAETAEKISLAKELITNGKTAEAEGMLLPLFDARRDRYTTGLLLGRIYTNAGNYGKARDLYRTLHQDYPDDHDITLLYVRSLIMAGNTERAEQVVSLLPNEDHPSLHLARAAVIKTRGEYTEALEEYRQALKLQEDPSIRKEIKSLEKLSNLQKADAALAAGNRDLAEAVLHPLYREEAGSYDAGLRLARIYQNKGEFDRAAAILGELCQTYPSDMDLRLTFIDTLLAAGNLPSAERELASLQGNDSPQVSLRKGRLMYRLKRYEEAVQSFRAAGDSLEPTVREEREAAEDAAALGKAVALMRAGKLDDAKALWNELFLSGRERYESGYQLGMSYLRQRDFARAGEHFTGLSEEFPKDPGFFALAVESRLLSRDVKKASAMVRDASPERADYLRREREDIIYRVHPNYAKISGLLSDYDNDISAGRELGITVSQRFDPITLVANAATIHRYGTDDSEVGAEVTFPVPGRPLYGTVGFTTSPDADFLPQVTIRGEGTYIRNGIEYSLGYTRMEFRESSADVMVVGVLGYLAPTLTLNERLYFVPEKGTFSLLSTLHYEPSHRLRGYYSLGLGTASETDPDTNAIDRYFTVSNRLGVEYRPFVSFSGGCEIFSEYRNGLYTRQGVQLFVKYWW